MKNQQLIVLRVKRPKFMSVDQARNLMRDSGISDGAFSNNDINKYIIEANKKHKDFIEYLKSLGF